MRGRLAKGHDGMKKDGREEFVDVMIPLDLPGEAAAYNETGDKQPAPSIQREQKGITIRSWTLRGGEVSIIHVR